MEQNESTSSSQLYLTAMRAASPRHSKDRKSHRTTSRIDSIYQDRTSRPLEKPRHRYTNESSAFSYGDRQYASSRERHRGSTSTISSLSATRSEVHPAYCDQMLSSTQKKIIELWCRDFLDPEADISIYEDRITGLATAIDGESQRVFGYTRQQQNAMRGHANITQARPEITTSGLLQSARDPPPSHIDLTGQNAHLPSPKRTLVEKYVAACRRRRSQTDGRRSVNAGPFKCTFGCGYRTKRAFDWRRHEETHEPQELWLCELCIDVDALTPFLVNRKDKFLRHATDKHSGHSSESILARSKVSYVPRPAKGCPRCGIGGSGGWSWDERCKHILRHFEDEIERSLKRHTIVGECKGSGEDRGDQRSAEDGADNAAGDDGY